MRAKKDGLSPRRLYNLMQLLYWTGGCAFVGFAAAFLQEIGFLNAEIGTISAASSAIGFALMLFVSARIDRTDGQSAYYALFITVAAQTLLLPAILCPGKPCLTVSAGYTLYLSLTLVLSSLVSKIYLDLRGEGVEIDFGFARGLGSLGYALGSLLLGYLLEMLHALPLLLLGHGLFLLLAAAAECIRRNGIHTEAAGKRTEEGGFRISALSSILKNYPRFLFLVLGIALVSCANKTLTLFLVNIVQNVGGNVASFGALGAFLSFLEVPVIFLFSRFRKKWNVAALLFASMLFYTLKIAGYCLAASVGALWATSLFHAFSTGLLHPASVEYVRETIPHRNSATAQSMINGAPLLFSFFASIIFGKLLDLNGTDLVLRLLLFLAALGTLICFLALHRRENIPSADTEP